MANHHKPTQEQLDKEIEETLKKAEALEENEDQEDEEEEDKKPLEKLEEKKEEDDAGNDDEEEGEGEEKPQDKTPEKLEEKKEEEKKQQPPDVKKRYEESSKEAQRLYKNNVEINKAIAEANDLPEPTEDELKAKFPEWEEMSTTEKRLSTETLINKRFREHINKASAAQREVEQWVVKVDKYLEDPQTFIDHPELEGKMDKFKTYATDDSKIAGTNFDVLVKSFLFDVAKNKSAPKKGSLLEKGSGGSNEKPKVRSLKFSLADADVIRRTDYKKYAQLVKDNMIEDDIPE